MSEIQLHLQTERPGGPAVAPRDVLWLEATLKASSEWVSADDLLAAVNKAGETHKRWLRAVAAESEWIISGNRGYKHLEHATARLDSQADKMKTRSTNLRRNFVKRQPRQFP